MIETHAFTLLPSAIKVNSRDLIAWEQSARTIMAIQRSVYWWIGDMVVFGESQFGEDFYQVIDPSVSDELIEACRRVSTEFPLDERNYTLSWTHHRLLLGFEKPMQQAMLARSESECWNSKQLSSYLTQIRKRHG